MSASATEPVVARPPRAAVRSSGSRRAYAWVAGLGLAVLAVAALSLNMGIIHIGPIQAIKTLAGAGTQRDETILFSFRLPRIALAFLVGCGLAVSGAILQSATQNDLGDPGVLGINSGAGLAVVIVVVVTTSSEATSISTSPWLLPASGLIGGLLVAAVVFVVATKNGLLTPTRLLLVGVAVGLFAAGVAEMLTLVVAGASSTKLAFVLNFLSGSLALAQWRTVLALLPWIVLLLPFAMYKAPTLNVIALGDQVASGLGVAVQRQRLLLLLVAVGLAASSVAVAGGIAFVGLIGPHMARRLVGVDNRAVIPVSALLGSVLVLGADLVGRTLFAPYDLPAGIVVAVIGAPYFLYLLAKTKG